MAVVVFVSGNTGRLSQARRVIVAPNELITVASGDEALALLSREKERIDGFFIDNVVTDGSGVDLLRKLDAGDGVASGVLMAGYKEYAPRATGSEPDRFFLLFEPFTDAQLLDLIKRVEQTAAMRRQMRKLRRARLGA